MDGDPVELIQRERTRKRERERETDGWRRHEKRFPCKVFVLRARNEAYLDALCANRVDVVVGRSECFEIRHVIKLYKVIETAVHFDVRRNRLYVGFDATRNLVA